MLKKVFQLSPIFLFSLALLACGNAGTGGGASIDDGGTGSSPNVGDGSGSGDLNAAAETIGVRIETNSEEGLIERNNISRNNISIVALNHEFREGHSTSIPSAITRQPENDGYELAFNKLYIEQANLVIKAIVGKDAQGKNIVLYAPLYTVGKNNSITVNIFSHYVVKKFFDTLETDEDLDEVIPCSVSACPNQVLAKANLLAQINETAQEYEITVPDTLSTTQSLEFLDTQIGFRTHIETAVAEITRSVSPIAKGTPRSFSLGSLARLQYNTQYNGLWFALSLNDLKPSNVIIATETSEIIDAGTLGNNAPIYPTFNQFSTFFDVRKEILSSDIPFTRASLTIRQNGSYDLEINEPINFLASLTQNDTSASTEGFLLNARSLSQQIPDDNGLKNIGWEFNPFFSKLYKANTYERDTDETRLIGFEDKPNSSVSPTWLLGANYQTGGSFNLSYNGTKPIRGAQKEGLNIFSWEVHGQQTDTTFTSSQLNGKTYGVINYSLNIEEGTSDDTILELFAETEQWNISNGAIKISQPSTDTHFQSYVRSREKDNTVNPPQNNLRRADSARDISTVKTEDHSGIENRGLLTLDGSLAPKGHSTQDGKHLAFVYEKGLGANGQDRGRGITIATELSSSRPIFPELDEDGDGGARYTLLGNTFGINAEANTLRNVNNALLTLSTTAASNDCNATLKGASILIKHTVGTEKESDQNTLSTPLIENTESIQSTACTLDGNQIEIKFDAADNTNSDDMFNQALTLKGFISPQGKIDDISSSNIPGNVISLLWIQDDNLGLVFATKDQQLSPTFD
jgi:hypothetical protein